MNMRIQIISRGWIGGSPSVSNLAHKFIIEKNIWAPAIKNNPRFR